MKPFRTKKSYYTALLAALRCTAPFLFMLSNGFSQVGDLSFQHLNELDGLTEGFNDFIKKDSRGYVWIGSANGLFRHDGLEMRNYNHDPTRPGGMLGKIVQSHFFEDSRGNIWFATYRGLNCYLWEKEAFVSLRLKNDDGIPYELDYSLLHLEGDSVLWIKAENRIFRYNRKTNSQREMANEVKGKRFAVDTLPDGRVKTIFSCPWLNAPGIEVMTVDPETGKVSPAHYLKNGLPAFPDQALEISNAMVENDTLVWLFSNLGLLAFDPRRPGGAALYTLPGRLYSTFIDGALYREDMLLVSSKNAGLWLFDRPERRFLQSYSSASGESNGTATNSIGEVYIDDEDHLWISNIYEKSVDHAQLQTNTFYYPMADWRDQPPLVHSITADERRNIWCADLFRGIYIFDRHGRLLRQIPYAAEKSGNFSSERRPDPIIHLSADQNGTVWAISNQKVYRFTNENWQVVYASKQHKLFDLIHVDLTNKVLATNGGVLQMQWQEESDRLLVTDTVTSERSFKGFSFSRRDSGVLYLPFREQELRIYQKKDGAFREWKRFDLGEGVYAVLEEPDTGRTLIGTTAGLRTFNWDAPAIEGFLTERTELAGLQINAIIKDQKGYYWLASDRGLFCWNPLRQELYTYQQEDGMKTPQFLPNAHFLAPDGKIWLGTTKGLLVFHPDSIRPHPFGPLIEIQSLSVNGQPYAGDAFIGKKRSFDFKYREKNLDFKIAALSSYSPKRNRIYYRLKGYEKQWKSVENGGSASFSQLPPGDYELQVYGENANGLKGPAHSFPLVIKSPIWYSPWFWLGVILVVLLAGGGLVNWSNRLYAKRKLAEQEEIFERERALQRALQDERNRIAADMHDDLGSGLTSISLKLGRAQEKRLASEEVVSVMAKVNAEIFQLIENMREIIWAMNGSYDNLPDLVAYLRSYVVEFLDQKDIQCRAHIPGSLDGIVISGKRRRNIFLTVKEAVHNIVKHADASQVEFSIQFRENLEISIKDNGRGIDLENTNPFSNGLSSMRKRMEDIGGTCEIKPDNGVLVKLTIPLTGRLETG